MTVILVMVIVRLRKWNPYLQMNVILSSVEKKVFMVTSSHTTILVETSRKWQQFIAFFHMMAFLNIGSTNPVLGRSSESAWESMTKICWTCGVNTFCYERTSDSLTHWALYGSLKCHSGSRWPKFEHGRNFRSHKHAGKIFRNTLQQFLWTFS